MDVVDVSHWRMNASWGARLETAASIGSRFGGTLDLLARTSSVLDVPWYIGDDQQDVRTLSASALVAVIGATTWMTSGEPDPTRGYSFTAVSDLIDGAYCSIRVHAGGVHEPRRSPANAVVIAFGAQEFGAPVELPLGGPHQFEQLGPTLRAVWDAHDVAVTFERRGSVG